MTGKAAPEHRSHLVSSLFQPTKEKEEKQKWSDQHTKKARLLDGWMHEDDDYLFVHFNVQPVGHFIVLQCTEDDK